MAYVSLSQSFGASKANLPVTITEVSTGLPAVILSSATGGLISTNGDHSLDGSGNLAVFVEGGRTWQVSVDAGAAQGPVGLLNSAQVAAGAVGVAGVTASGVIKDAAGNTIIIGGGIGGEVGAAVVAPATLDVSNAAAYNGRTLNLPAAGTMTVNDGAWALLPAGVAISVGQSGSASLAFSGTATKENASGTSATSVTLAASGIYALLPSPTGSPRFRLSGGASL